MTTKLSILGLAIIVGFSACSNDKEEAAEEAAVVSEASADTTQITVNDTTKFKFDFAIANIPSPASSVQELAAWGVPYDNSALNSLKNMNNYTSEFEKGINLGVYNIDMAYAMVHDQGQDVLQYMKNVLQLSESLGLRGAVNNMVGKRAESNLNNKDSLFRILDEIFIKSDSYLRTNERVYTAATVFAGSWVESLYLTCHISAKADEKGKSEGRKHLWEQRFHLGNLINLLRDYKDKKEIQSLVAELEPIHKEITEVKNHTDMTDEKFSSIYGKLSSLREKLVKK